MPTKFSVKADHKKFFMQLLPNIPAHVILQIPIKHDLNYQKIQCIYGVKLEFFLAFGFCLCLMVIMVHDCHTKVPFAKLYFCNMFFRVSPE